MRFSRIVVIGLILLVMLVPMWRGFETPAAAMDEGLLLVYPEQIQHGKLPYRDFEVVTSPGNFWILSGAYRVFGNSIFVERGVGLVYRLVILSCVFAIAARWGTPIAFGCTAVAGVLVFLTELTAYTWIAAITFALCSLSITGGNKVWFASFFGGLSAGIAVLCRIDLVLAVAISATPLFIAMGRKEKLYYAIGLVIGLLPLALLMLFVGPGQLARCLVTFPAFHLTAGRHIPMSDAPNSVQVLFWAYVIASLVNLTAALRLITKDRSDSKARLLFAVAVFGLGLIHYALQRFDFSHVLFAAFLPISFLPLSIFILLSDVISGRRWVIASISTVAVALALHLTFPELAHYFARAVGVSLGFLPARQISTVGEVPQPGDKAFFIQRHGRAFPFATMVEARAAENTVAELDRVSSSGERLFVGPGDLRRTNYNDTYIYYLVPKLPPATYYLEMNPLSANAPDSRLANDVATADWAVLNRFWDGWSEPNDSMKVGSDAPNAVIREQFRLWAECGPYQIYRNNRQRSVGVLR